MNNSATVKAQDIRYYFEKFERKMGSNTTLQTAMGWAEGAGLNNVDTVVLKNKIRKYLNK